MPFLAMTVVHFCGTMLLLPMLGMMMMMMMMMMTMLKQMTAM